MQQQPLLKITINTCKGQQLRYHVRLPDKCRVCVTEFVQIAAYLLVLEPTLQPETRLISCPSLGPPGPSEAAPQTGLPL